MSPIHYFIGFLRLPKALGSRLLIQLGKVEAIHRTRITATSD
ncbi:MULTISPECIES: hypothetical protein [Microcystis]|uniref:Uncharacterized protein n=1 Tax=Microcystis panniformis FACHB-1757 TaxID=1638788 RepID=A0A0K1RWH5_9CHRO|nr:MULTISPECIES: hypothetical protein [Microcystis]AKV66113.1 hypothetical protein VL20_924 [Microcystis panniformis FACHB-1757]MCZ8045775.1 hypothetical protein [Microcystis sp. LE19-41.2A]MCZ8287652.1 hypothetical protein [Microcystis sp. LE19-59.1C]